MKRRFRVPLLLLGAAVSLALIDPIYAALRGEVIEIGGLRLSLFAGALLVLSLATAARELVRKMSKQ